MTDLVNLAQRLHRRIKWQEIPEELTSADLIDILCDAIRMLYVISGRTFQFSEDMFIDALPTEGEEEATDMAAVLTAWALMARIKSETPAAA